MKIPEIYINLHLYGRKNKANFFGGGPQYNLSMKFGPPEKKSGHPCNIWFSKRVLYGFECFSLEQFVTKTKFLNS